MDTKQMETQLYHVHQPCCDHAMGAVCVKAQKTARAAQTGQATGAVPGRGHGLLGSSSSETKPRCCRQLRPMSEPHNDTPAGIPFSRALLVLTPWGPFIAVRNKPPKNHSAVAQSLPAASAAGTRCPCMPCCGCAASGAAQAAGGTLPRG